MKEIPKTKGDIPEDELELFKEAKIYFLKKDKWWVFSPALIIDTEEIVVCLDKNILLRVLEKLEERYLTNYKIVENIFLVDEGRLYGFVKDHPAGNKTPTFRLLNEFEFEKRTREVETAFIWKPDY